MADQGLRYSFVGKFRCHCFQFNLFCFVVSLDRRWTPWGSLSTPLDQGWCRDIYITVTQKYFPPPLNFFVILPCFLRNFLAVIRAYTNQPPWIKVGAGVFIMAPLKFFEFFPFLRAFWAVILFICLTYRRFCFVSVCKKTVSAVRAGRVS